MIFSSPCAVQRFTLNKIIVIPIRENNPHSFLTFCIAFYLHFISRFQFFVLSRPVFGQATGKSSISLKGWRILA